MVRQLAPALNQLALVGGYAFSCLPGKAGERASVPEAESNRALRRDRGRNRLEPPAPDCCQCSIVENSGGFRVDYARCTERRSEESRAATGCVSPCRSRWWR